MNLKSKIKNWILLLMLANVPGSIWAAVTIETTSTSISASTSEKGVRGYQGCEAAELAEVPAYVFILLSNGRADDKDPDPCKDDGPFDEGPKKLTSGWEEINRLTSEEPQLTFDNLPEGRYRVEVLVGQAIGCQVNGGAATMPQQSIVYLQEKTSPVILGSPKEVSDSPELKTGNQVLNNLEVFPNPTSNELQIQLHNPELGTNTRIVLYDLLGRALIEKKESTAGSGKTFSWTMDVGQFLDGAYLLVVEDEKGHSYREKIIIQKD